jgi:hypothetical protein
MVKLIEKTFKVKARSDTKHPHVATFPDSRLRINTLAGRVYVNKHDMDLGLVMECIGKTDIGNRGGSTVFEINSSFYILPDEVADEVKIQKPPTYSKEQARAIVMVVTS